MDASIASNRRPPWNKGKLVGQKASLKVKDIWAIRVRLQIRRGRGRTRPAWCEQRKASFSGSTTLCPRDSDSRR